MFFPEYVNASFIYSTFKRGNNDQKASQRVKYKQDKQQRKYYQWSIPKSKSITSTHIYSNKRKNVVHKKARVLTNL